MSEQLLPGPERIKPAFTPEVREKPHLSSAEKPKTTHERLTEITSSYEQAVNEAKTTEALTPQQEPAPPQKQDSGVGRKQAYASTLQLLAREQSSPERIFSRFIHNRLVESISDSSSHTIARPRPLLWAGMGACLTLAFFYLIAQRYGYQMSGFEGIAGLLGGYLIGFIIDLLRRRSD